MEIMEKTGEVRDAVRRARLRARMERAQSDLDALNEENDALRDKLDREQTAVKQVTEAAREPKPHRVRRVLALAVAAGGAYVAGSAAGRERYEQIRGWFPRGTNEGLGSPAAIRDRTAETIEDAGTKAQRLMDRAGNAAQNAAVRTGDGAKDAATQAGGVAKDKLGHAGSVVKDAASKLSTTVADDDTTNS